MVYLFGEKIFHFQPCDKISDPLLSIKLTKHPTEILTFVNGSRPENYIITDAS